ncbi:MAG: Uma2 family endonuclease [Hymenobacteraceae bacterium]|nr:Uma2 family endonuclease [Hymenobacteraceae bacterium]
MPAPITDISQLDPNGTYSYADYLKWRFDEAVELFRGKIQRMSPAPSMGHQLISQNLELLLGLHLRGQPCRMFHAPFDVRLPKHPGDPDSRVTTVVQPDIFVVCDPSKFDRRGCNGAPDWIMEILSPGNTRRDLRDKYRLYEEHGVTEYWIISPGDRNITVFTLQNGQYEVVGEWAEPGPVPSATLPEFVLDWTDVFEGV